MRRPASLLSPSVAPSARATRVLAAAMYTALHVSVAGCSPEPLDPSAGVPDAAPQDVPTPSLIDAGGPAPDAAAPITVAHVPVDGAFPGDLKLILGDGAVIDTDALRIDGVEYAGEPGDPVVFDAWPQSRNGPEMAVLHVGDFGIEDGVVQVRGGRPLVIIAAREIVLAGALDAGARGATPGPGGFAPGEGPGAGADGQHAGDNQDGGGGGGGHGSAGGDGGTATSQGVVAPGGPGGGTTGVAAIDILQGGSGGGLGAAIESDLGECPPSLGGAGGGAVQLTAFDRIRIEADGAVLAGGGGGLGGTSGLACAPAAGGGGGGGGGAIYLQAPIVLHRGLLAAGGGGGGSGGDLGESSPGSDGLADVVAAPGGSQTFDVGHAGGCGDAAVVECIRSGAIGAGNGGGGGGGAGRIAVAAGPGRYDVQDGRASPSVNVISE